MSSKKDIRSLNEDELKEILTNDIGYVYNSKIFNDNNIIPYESTKEEILEALIIKFSDFHEDHGLVFPSATWIVTAKK